MSAQTPVERPPDGAALERWLECALATEVPDGALCAHLATVFARGGDGDLASRWAIRTVDAPPDYSAWRRAAQVLDEVCPGSAPVVRRELRVAVVANATVTPLLCCLRLALARCGIAAELHEAPYGQYWQGALDERSGLRAFGPDVVVFVPDHRSATGPDPDAPWTLAEEVARWTAPWSGMRAWSSAELVQVSLVQPEADAFGGAAAAVPGSRRSRLRALDHAIAEAAGEQGVAHIDAEALAGAIGKRNWFEPRYWHAAKHAFSRVAAPELALRIAGAVAARVGLSRRVLILDLDDTLWPGVIGDDGLRGIELTGPRGEALVEFQHVVRALGRRGVVLAACSKNDLAAAQEPFREHPDMVLSLDDFSAFVASWQPKPVSIREISDQLGLPLDSCVFVDDNPAEREAVRQALPEVDVLVMPTDPSGWPDVLGRYAWLEPGTLTDDDRRRADSYRARAAAADLAGRITDLEQFLRSLRMRAVLAPIGPTTIERAAQLLAKTNQFNLTGRRHRTEELRAMLADPDWFHLTARLSDRFADHGIVAVALARSSGTVLEVDSLVMSCRVIGRQLETVLIAALAAEGRSRGLQSLRGHYASTDRNGLVADLWASHGFDPLGRAEDGERAWELDLTGAPRWSAPIAVEQVR